MLDRLTRMLAAAGLALAALASAGTAASQEKPKGDPAQTCTLDYQRADNMWAAWGRADGGLGAETLTLQAGQFKVFLTDWRYEKQRNDGTTYYGSHLRIAANKGPNPMQLKVKPNPYVTDTVLLLPGATQEFKADLVQATCLSL